MAKPKNQGGDAARSKVRFDGPSWQSGPAVFLAGQEEIDDMDLVAKAMEDKWGCDRLRLLVPKDLREKFDRQRLLTNTAIKEGELEDLRRECKRMVTAWNALDRAAEAAGADPRPGEVWECVGPSSGTVYAIVRQASDARGLKADGRHVSVYTLEEIATLLDGFPAIVKAKQTFKGAAVVKVRSTIGDPLNGIDHVRDDPMPF